MVFCKGKESAVKPLTCLIKKEGNQYASLCVELDIASCGKNKREALEGLRDAAEAYLEYMIAENRRDEIYRPVPINELKEFLFSGDEVSEQSFKAIPLALEHA